MCSIKSIERGIFLAVYRGVNGANREIKQIYRGVNGVNRKIQRQYRGINGTNKVVFRDGYGLDEIAQVVFKVYHASAVSLKGNVTYNNLEMEWIRASGYNGGFVHYAFRIPTNEQIPISCASIQVSGEYKIQFLDGTELPFNYQTLSESLGITSMTMKYCMGAISFGFNNVPEITGSLKVLEQTETAVKQFEDINVTGLILKKSVNYYGIYPQSSMANLAVYAGSSRQQYPEEISYFTEWAGEKNLNHVFLQKGQYTYESDITIVDARK